MDSFKLCKKVKEHIFSKYRTTLIDASNTTQIQKDEYDYNCGRFMTHYILHRREAGSLETYTAHLENVLKNTGYDKFFEALNNTIVTKILEETP